MGLRVGIERLFIANRIKSLLDIVRGIVYNFKTRVLNDGGEVSSDTDLSSYITMAKANGMWDSIKFGMLGGYNLRTDGSTKYVTRSYSFDSVPNDATQTTEASQPFQTGFIAPNEKWGLKNPNGDRRYVTHPEISFSATDEWSVTTVLNWNGEVTDNCVLYGKDAVTASTLQIKQSGFYKFNFINESINGANAGTSSTLLFLNKNKTLTLVANGSKIKYYIDGVEITYMTISTEFVFNRLFDGRSYAKFGGTISAHIIRSQALTPTQVEAEYNWFKQHGYLGYEGSGIPAVKIGDQVWATSNCEMVATPMGNVIQEMQANSAETLYNTINLTYRWFGVDAVIDNSTQFTPSVANGYVRNQSTLFALEDKKSYKFVVSATGGSYKLKYRNGSTGKLTLIGSGDGTYYFKVNSGTSDNQIAISGDNANVQITITGLSVEELGWADSQELYDGLIAQGESVQTALKASAMWCYYNNDPSLGATYGKLYNWFAVKLLQMDIDAYNLANPSTPWGWHVPSEAEFNTLATALGGASVAGGKMKVAGTDYWNSPNTGADNSSGFSSLAGGSRNDSSGLFSSVFTYFQLWGVDASILSINNAYASIYIVPYTGRNPKGMSVRLITD